MLKIDVDENNMEVMNKVFLADISPGRSRTQTVVKFIRNSFLLLIPISILFLSSCCGGPYPTLSGVGDLEKDITYNHNSIQLNAFCFYELDDKYSETNADSIIIKWLNDKSKHIVNRDSMPNIFDHNGGGPNGAQWNPATNLYIAIFFDSSKSKQNPILRIHGERYTGPFFEFNRNLIWYRVSREFWEEEAKEIDSLDMKDMYSQEFRSKVQNKEIIPITDLDYGEILRFDVSLESGPESVTKFFHATYGE